MLHLLDEANEENDNNRDEDVRHEEDNPTGVVRREIRDFEQHPTADQICVEENEFHQQNQEDKLQCALVIGLDSDFFQLLIYFRHQMKP
jgi:hypothetical protein